MQGDRSRRSSTPATSSQPAPTATGESPISIKQSIHQRVSKEREVENRQSDLQAIIAELLRVCGGWHKILFLGLKKKSK